MRKHQKSSTWFIYFAARLHLFDARILIPQKHQVKREEEREVNKEVKQLTTQAEYVLPFWVFLQQPPLLISHRKAPEAVTK